jgi:hypothetical protein
MTGLVINNPESRAVAIEPGETAVVFDASKSTGVDGTTQFSITSNPLDSSRYRFTHSAGTSPALRTDKPLSLSGVELELTANANGTLTVVSQAGTPFAGLVAGDMVFVPGTSTGDVSVGFDSLNEGFWTVLSVAGATVTLVRPSSEVFQGVSETVTPTDNGVLAFGAAGIQVGDKVDVNAGFSSALKTFDIVSVTSRWFEVVSTSPLAQESGIPGATGMLFYRGAKRFVRVEADQEVAIRVNGDSGDSQRVVPWVAGDPRQVGEYTRTGPTWTLSVRNRSAAVAQVLVISVE